MKGILIFAIYVTVCFLKTCQPSNLKTRESLCIIAGVILRSSGHPTYYEPIIEKVEEESVESSEVLLTTMKTSMLRPTTTTTESNVQDEWQLRGQSRIKCVDEVGVVPSKVVNLMSGKYWQINDIELKKWVLCVLNKMNLMSKEGVYKMDVAMSKIADADKADAEALINHCLPTRSMKPYEIAWKYVSCHNTGADRENFSVLSVF